MEFFAYTKGVSSSALKRQMNGGEISGKLFLFGAGNYGRKALRELRDKGGQSEYDVAGFIDNAPDKRHTMVDGVKVYGLDELPLVAPDDLFTIMITVKEKEEIRKQLQEAGVKRIIDYEV